MEPRRLVRAALVLSLCALFAPVAVFAAGDDASIVALERSLWEAWKTHDAAPFQQHLAENTINTTAAGRTSGKAKNLEMMGSADCTVTSYTLGDMTVQRFGEHTAIVTYEATQDAVCSGNKIPAQVMVTSVWVEVDGKWQAASYQETAPAAMPGG